MKKSNVTGVNFKKGKWSVRITKNKKEYSLGSYGCLDTAIKLRAAVDDGLFNFDDYDKAKKHSGELTKEVANILINYDKESGLFYRNLYGLESLIEKESVGTKSSTDGRLYLSIKGKSYPLHRLAWFCTHGYWPEEIDHINGNILDNRLENLRNVTHAENMKNQKTHATNRSGFRGVSWDKVNKKWRVSIHHENKAINGGRYSDLEDAILARLELEKEYGYHDNHGR